MSVFVASKLPIHTDNTHTIKASVPGGGGTWYICPTGMCRFSGYRFRLFFLEEGIKRSKEGKFSGAGCQSMSKEEILLQRVII